MSRHDEMPSVHLADRRHSPAVRYDIQIDRVSSAAICEEIGDRLRINLTGEPGRLPQHMMMLVEQMAQNDCVSAVFVDSSETGANRSNLS